jgi:hypothetical protein
MSGVHWTYAKYRQDFIRRKYRESRAFLNILRIYVTISIVVYCHLTARLKPLSATFVEYQPVSMALWASVLTMNGLALAPGHYRLGAERGSMNSERCDFEPRLQALGGEFVSAVGHGENLSVSPVHYLYDDAAEQTQYPNADEPGCHVFVSGDGQVKYVGKGARHLGSRTGAHMGRTARAGEAKTYPNFELWLQECKPHIAAHTTTIGGCGCGCGRGRPSATGLNRSRGRGLRSSVGRWLKALSIKSVRQGLYCLRTRSACHAWRSSFCWLCGGVHGGVKPYLH